MNRILRRLVMGCATLLVVIATSPTTSSASPGRHRHAFSATALRPVGKVVGSTTRVTRAESSTLAATSTSGNGVSLSQDCAPASIVRMQLTTCTVTAANTSLSAATVNLTTSVDNGLRIAGTNGATIDQRRLSATAGPIVLAAGTDFQPAIGPGSSPTGGYLPLDLFGITPTPIGDEEALNFDVDPFLFGGQTFNRIGVVSNGYLVLGGTTGPQDISFVPSPLPDPILPNGILAPYWTDLTGGGAPGIFLASLTDGVNRWTVVEWRMHLFGDTTARRTMQVWIGTNGVEDVSFTYDPQTYGQSGEPGVGLVVGAENLSGTAGDEVIGPPTQEYVVTTIPGVPGGSTAYSLLVQGKSVGTSIVRTAMTDGSGTTSVSSTVKVTKR